MNIIKATSEDLKALHSISVQTFTETFAPFNTPENMQMYLTECLRLDTLHNELNNINSSFYFATEANNIIGYLKINFKGAQTEIKDQNALEIERIYVLKAYLGKQVGKLLLDTAVQIAKVKNLRYIWLGVWEQNIRAINFYRKNGFIEFGKHTFMLGHNSQTDIMMKLPLTRQPIFG